MRRSSRTVVQFCMILGCLVATGACGGDDGTSLDGATVALCDLAESLTAQGGFPEGIPALTEPALLSADQATYLIDSDRVLGVVVDGEPRAYPHNILWSHEVVNDRFGDAWVTVSFCPLTGSGIAMDATVNGRRVEFAVSGLLFANNLVMFDRLTEDLWGPQLAVTGKCQRFSSVTPTYLPVREMSWGEWKSLYPSTKVLSDDTGYARNYRLYPYGSYDEVGNSDLLFPMQPDDSRPIKERVLGVRTSASGGRGYPFGELAELGPVAVINDRVAGQPVAIFYRAANGETAVAYDPVVDGQTLTFDVVGDAWQDRQTGSTWNLGGTAISGPLASRRLEPLENGYVVFWFAWKHFQPDADIWTTN